MSHWTCPALVLLACVLQTACDGRAANSTDTPATPIRHDAGVIEVPASSPLRGRLDVMAFQPSEISRPLNAPGAIEAAPEMRVSITPPVAGRVLRIHRVLGDEVRAGDALFTLDSAEAASARAEHARTAAAAAQARRDFERERRLFDADVTARKDFEAARLGLASAEADARVAAAHLAQLGADRGSGRTYVLHSPISGRVVEMQGAQGGYWNDINAALMTVADLSTVWMTASVPEREVGRLFVGQPANIVLDALPGQVLAGQVRYIDELLDPETRSVRVRVALANPDGRLRPGMFGRVVLQGRAESSLMVPATSVIQEGMSSRVFVERAPFRFEPRTVTVGFQQGERVEIVSGLKPGERIVTRNGVLLND